MFLHLSVILFTGDVCPSAYWDTEPQADTHPPPNWLLLRTVRILLEYILVQKGVRTKLPDFVLYCQGDSFTMDLSWFALSSPGYLSIFHYHPQTKLRKGSDFTPVCDSVRRGVEVCTPSSAQTPLNPPPSPLAGIATEAGTTHPTGMHYCFVDMFVQRKLIAT